MSFKTINSIFDIIRLLENYLKILIFLQLLPCIGPGACEYGPELIPGYGGGASGYPALGGGGALAS